MITEAFYNFCWAAIGVVVGCLVTRETLRSKKHQEAILSETATKPPRPGRLFGVLVIILALYSVAQGSYFAFENNKTAQCQARFNDDFARVATQRAKWTDEDRQALTKMLTGVVEAKDGTTAGRDSVTEYLETTRRNERLRLENPLPKLEERRC